MNEKIVALLVGIGFGAVLVAARLNEFNTIHKMLLLQEVDVFLLMGSAIATAAPILWWLRRSHWRTPSGEVMAVPTEPVQRKHVFGAVLFGTGWAVTGACPAPALLMAATGTIMGLPLITGLMLGAALRDSIATPADPRVAVAAGDRSGC